MSNEAIISAIGRRKTATARVRLTPGSGKILINGRPYDDYFPVTSFQGLVLKPLEVAKSRNTYDITAKGSNIRVVLNGVETLNINDTTLSKGVITLQRSAGVVKYRKVQIRPL